LLVTYNSIETMDAALRKPSMPMRFRWPVWVIVISVLVIVHLVLFGYVQNMVDMRRCIGYSPDPLFRFIAFNERWRFVTMTMYGLVVATAVLAMIVQAVRGLEFPFLRLAIASSITSTIRIATLYLIPLCNPFVAAGGPPPLHAFSTVHLYFFQLPFRPFALNDLVFSGHTAIYLLILYANPQWPAVVRAAFAGFILLMMYALIATRDHYTVDLLLAIPCSFFADRVALALLDRVRRVPGRRSISV
jgi:hypothetical protein